MLGRGERAREREKEQVCVNKGGVKRDITKEKGGQREDKST